MFLLEKFHLPFSYCQSIIPPGESKHKKEIDKLLSKFADFCNTQTK